MTSRCSPSGARNRVERGSCYNRAMSERTLAIIKPDAVEKRLDRADHPAHRSRGIPDSCHEARPSVEARGEGFYAVHRERPFFASLTAFMSSGRRRAGPRGRRRHQEVAHADGRDRSRPRPTPGTLRKEFAESIERNATHGSDAPETAAYEIGYFFAGVDLIERRRGRLRCTWARSWSSVGLGIAGLGAD